jgi:hypothetical protein
MFPQIAPRNDSMNGQSPLKWLAVGLILGTVAGSAMTGLIAAVYCRMREAGERSKTVFATRAVIEDLDETLKRGDCKLAAAKTALFRKRWQEWIDNDAYPSGWFSEIVNLRQ